MYVPTIEPYTDAPKIRIFIVLYILRVISKEHFIKSHASTAPLSRQEYLSILFDLFYVFTIHVFYKYWCTVPEDDARKRVETWMRSSDLIVIHFVFNIVHFSGYSWIFSHKHHDFRKQFIKHKICFWGASYPLCYRNNRINVICVYIV